VRKACALFILFFIILPLWAQKAVKNRTFELSLINLDFNLSNSFLTAGNFINSADDANKTGKFFKDSISINFNGLFRGFSLNFGANIKPLSLNFNWKDKWGVGLDIAHINVTGNLALSENLLSFNEVTDDKFGTGAAVFTDVGLPVFFHYNKLKLKIRPSVFLPLIYTEPSITYSYKKVTNPDTGDSGMRFQVNYDMRVYTVVDMRDKENDFGAVMDNLLDNAQSIAENNLGYDLSLGAEYPLYDWLDIGVDIINIPLVMANLNNYMLLEGKMFFDSSKINIDGMINGEDFPEDAYGFDNNDIAYKNNGSTKIYRPFTALFYAKLRPFESSPGFSLIPSLGFSLNPLYTQIASIEGGLSARFDLANIFVMTIGINYNDRRWKNSIDFVLLNLRAFELDLGISFQSPDFVKSWQGAGFGIAAGLKIGW